MYPTGEALCRRLADGLNSSSNYWEHLKAALNKVKCTEKKPKTTSNVVGKLLSQIYPEQFLTSDVSFH